MRHVTSLDDSRLFQRLREAPARDPVARTQLEAGVRALVQRADWISGQTVRFLPQYTLHNHTHLFNVLSLMEELLPDETLAHLTPLECALCLLAAFTHDLGMVPADEEHRRLYDEQNDTEERRRFLRHRDNYAEETRQIERLRGQNTADAHRRADLLEGHLLAEFLRRTHASDPKRVLGWFDRIEDETGNKSLFRYGNLDFKHDLALLAISHNQDAHWLRERLTHGGDADEFLRHAGTERVNYAFPGLLLRLADYMDFDATRAPALLYRHFGIENDISVGEWQKHMAITGWQFQWKQQPSRLLYEARDCQRPIYEKTIRDFARDIEGEVRRVRDELACQTRALGSDGENYALRLPEKVEARVRPARRNDGREAYLYHEMQFHLDQEEIMGLLMGESLYGDPSLCLRELVQNSLDALQMRHLRLQILEEQPDAPVEKTDRLAKGEELEVHLTWGRDEASGQEYIRITDNGTGMTRRTLEDYFTKLGRSYYQSPDFERERTLLRAQGLFATPISIFGIGILSCFMIADRLQVRTCPGGADAHERAPYDVTISGPGSLFWLSPGTRRQQGTDVTLYLKPQFRTEHDPENFIKRLQQSFGLLERFAEETEEIKESDDLPEQIDVPLVVTEHVQWPQFPILMGEEGAINPIQLDDRFHLDRVMSIDKEKVTAKAQEWHCPEERLGEIYWATFDWIDETGPEATGSRIRLAYPRHFPAEDHSTLSDDLPLGSNLCRLNEIAALVEATLGVNLRTLPLVKGMRIVNSWDIREMFTIASGVGSLLWIDLRGDAAPRLTANRQQALRRKDVEGWEEVVQGVFRRWAVEIQNRVEHAAQFSHLWLYLIRWHEELRPMPAQSPLHQFRLLPTCLPSWAGRRPATLLYQWQLSRYDQELSLGRSRDLDRDHDLNLDRTRANAFAAGLNHALGLNRTRFRNLGLDLDRDLDCDLDCDRDRALGLAFSRYLDLNLARALNLTRARDLDSRPSYGHSLEFHFFMEAFQPSLEESYLWLGCRRFAGRIGDAVLDGPGIASFSLEADGRTVRFADPDGHKPDSLVAYSYDLVFPLTGIPLGHLRRDCPEWRTDRRLRSVGTLPFLLLGDEEVWQQHADFFRNLFQVNRLYALLPRFDLWDKPFAEWSLEEWQTCGLSALWDISTGKVLWANGAHPIDDMPHVGMPIEEFLATHG